MGEQRPEAEELDLAWPTMGEARRGWGCTHGTTRARGRAHARRISCLRSPSEQRYYLGWCADLTLVGLLLASGREEEAELRGV